MPTPQELTGKGMKLYATAEKNITEASEALWMLGDVFIEATTIYAIDDGEGLQMRNRCRELAGKLAAIHSLVIDSHKDGTSAAKAASADINAPYAELPPKDPSIPRPKSGGDR